MGFHVSFREGKCCVLPRLFVLGLGTAAAVRAKGFLHYPYINPIYYSSFHVLFHCPHINPIYIHTRNDNIAVSMFFSIVLTLSLSIDYNKIAVSMLLSFIPILSLEKCIYICIYIYIYTIMMVSRFFSTIPLCPRVEHLGRGPNLETVPITNNLRCSI